MEGYHGTTTTGTEAPFVILNHQQGSSANYTTNVTEYLSAEEIQALNTMRQEMQKYGYNLPDEKLVQALMARKFEVDRAVSLVTNQLEWKQAHANDLVLDERIVKELRTCKVLAPPNSRDRLGAQIVYFSPRYHQPHESTPYDVFRMVYYLIDHLVEDITTQRFGFTIIVDLRGAGWRNFESKLPQVFVKNMQNRFPGRLHTILILNPPKLFKVMYSMVKPFVPDKYLCKISVVDSQQVLQFVEPNNLLQEHGGTMAFDQASFINTLVTKESQQQQKLLQQHQQQQWQPQQQFVDVGTGGL